MLVVFIVCAIKAIDPRFTKYKFPKSWFCSATKCRFPLSIINLNCFDIKFLNASLWTFVNVLPMFPSGFHGHEINTSTLKFYGDLQPSEEHIIFCLMFTFLYLIPDKLSPVKSIYKNGWTGWGDNWNSVTQ